MKWQIGLTDQLILLAREAGFEPTPAALDTATQVLKTRVLPLHYSRIFTSYDHIDHSQFFFFELFFYMELNLYYIRAQYYHIVQFSIFRGYNKG